MENKINYLEGYQCKYSHSEGYQPEYLEDYRVEDEVPNEFYGNCIENYSSMIRNKMVSGNFIDEVSDILKSQEYFINHENEVRDICNNVYLSIKELNPNISYEETKTRVMQCLSKIRKLL